MDLDHLQNRLIAAARTIHPSDAVPFAFEKRIMARLTERPMDALGAWSVALWRAAVSCIVLVLLSGVWSAFSPSQEVEADFSRDFETAVFASAYSGDEVW
jgi:hypothetical protein